MPGPARSTAELFGAFPDNAFALSEIVVGPQGVFEVATLTGTNLGPWAGAAATGLPIALQVLILFPWDPATERFTGERIWFDRGALARLEVARVDCRRRRGGSAGAAADPRSGSTNLRIQRPTMSEPRAGTAVQPMNSASVINRSRRASSIPASMAAGCSRPL